MDIFLAEPAQQVHTQIHQSRLTCPQCKLQFESLRKLYRHKCEDIVSAEQKTEGDILQASRCICIYCWPETNVAKNNQKKRNGPQRQFLRDDLIRHTRCLEWNLNLLLHIEYVALPMTAGRLLETRFHSFCSTHPRQLVGHTRTVHIFFATGDVSFQIVCFPKHTDKIVTCGWDH